MKTIDMNSPMTWKEFKALPDDLRAEYVRRLMLTFGANRKELAAMFGVSGNTIFTWASSVTPRLSFPKHPHLDVEAWRRFLDGECGPTLSRRVPEDTPKADDTSGRVAPPVPAPRQVPPSLRPDSGTLTYRGDCGAICRAIFDLLGGDKYAVSITFVKEAD